MIWWIHPRRACIYTHHLMDIWRIYSVASSTDGPGQKIYKREINLFLGKKKKLYNTHIISSTWLCCGIGWFFWFFFRAETSDTSRSTTPNTPTSFIKRRFSLSQVSERIFNFSFISPLCCCFLIIFLLYFFSFRYTFPSFLCTAHAALLYTFDSALYIIISSQ